MTSKARVDSFVALRRLALVGASRSGKKFGNTILRELSAKGYEVVPVHPHAATIDGCPCVPNLAALAPPVGGVVVVVPPAETVKVVEEARAAGISKVWIQQGAGSPEALRVCREHGIDVVNGECILMFAEPVHTIHAFHRFLWRVFGKLPK